MPRKRILIVEDDAETARALEEILIHHGYDTAVAGDGSEALRRAQDTKPDLVIMDADLPSLNGFDACRQIKDDAAHKGAGVIMLTSLHGLPDIDKAFKAGADCYINKPADPDRLISKIEKYIRK
jgi:DNA-binding response OmpR family regulator